MSKQRRFILIAAAIGALSVFLPWITASAGAFGYSVSNSTNGFRGSGVFYFLLMTGVAIVCGAVGERTRLLDKTMRLVVLLAGVIGAVCVVYYFTDMPSGFSTGYGGVDVSPSIGAILALAAAVAVVILPLVFKAPGESLQGDWQNLREKVQSVNGVREPFTPEPTTAQTTARASRMDELEKLLKWREEGKISEEEYKEMKDKIIA